MTTAAVKEIVVKLVSPIVLSERGDDSDVIVRIGEKDYKASIRNRYENGKYSYKVFVEGYDENKLKEIGVAFDTESIVNAHEKAVKERTTARKEKEDKEKTEVYNWWKRLGLTIGFEIVGTLEGHLKTYGRPCLQYAEKYKGVDIGVVITQESNGWYHVRKEHSWNRENTRRTSKSSKLKELADDILQKARQEVDYKQKAKAAENETLAKAKAALGDDVTEAEVYGRNRKGSYSQKVLQVIAGDKYDSPKVQFSLSSDGKYFLNAVTGYYTKEEMQTILKIVRSKKETK